MIGYTENILDDLVVLSRNNFVYDEGDETLKDFYKKAFAEDRFIYLYQNSECIGYLVFYLFNRDSFIEILKKKSGFNFPEHRKDGQYLFIEDCVIFKQYRNCLNLLHLRKIFAKAFPQIRNVSWHKSLTGENKQLFNLPYSAERK